MDNAVGPVLRMAGDDVELIVRAIEDDNPGHLIEVVDSGAYVRIQANGFLRVSVESLKRHLGAGFELRQLESIMSAFAGRINTTSDEITWQYKTSGEAAANAAH